MLAREAAVRSLEDLGRPLANIRKAKLLGSKKHVVIDFRSLPGVFHVFRGSRFPGWKTRKTPGRGVCQGSSAGKGGVFHGRPLANLAYY